MNNCKMLLKNVGDVCLYYYCVFFFLNVGGVCLHVFYVHTIQLCIHTCIIYTNICRTKIFLEESGCRTR